MAVNSNPKCSSIDIVIKNVDVYLLNRQRFTLAEVIERLRHVDITTAEEDGDLEGILNMLEAWSDKYFEEKE